MKEEVDLTTKPILEDDTFSSFIFQGNMTLTKIGNI